MPFPTSLPAPVTKAVLCAEVHGRIVDGEVSVIRQSTPGVSTFLLISFAQRRTIESRMNIGDIRTDQGIVSDSGDLKDFVMERMRSTPGVNSVDVSRDGNLVRVDIAVKDLEFDTCKPVYAKELELYNEFPDYDFQFNVSAI
jgi:hypothetical protein